VSRFYFAYGSNMNPQRVAGRGLRFDRVCGASLDDVRLAFDKQSREHPHCGHANLAYERRSRVEGVLYRLRDADEIGLMDQFERTPFNYSREIVVVAVGDARFAAWTYFANPAVTHLGLRPERAYLEHLLAGRPYLSHDYFDRLNRVRCADD
jgi:gamma-glutamyl AIG2-like cyclotransferase